MWINQQLTVMEEVGTDDATTAISACNAKKKLRDFFTLDKIVISYACDVKLQWNMNTIGQMNLPLDSGTTKSRSIHKTVVQFSSD